MNRRTQVEHLSKELVTRLLSEDNSTWSPELAEQFAKKVMAEVRAPYVKAYVSALGGPERASVMITVGLDPRGSWKNGILENSRYAKLAYNVRGGQHVLYQHSGHGATRFRKTTITSPEKAVAKLNAWVQSNEKIDPAGPGSPLEQRADLMSDEERERWISQGMP